MSVSQRRIRRELKRSSISLRCKVQHASTLQTQMPEKNFSRGPTPLGPSEEPLPGDDGLARGRRGAFSPPLCAPPYHVASILESDPIIPRRPGNTCLVSGQHVPTLEIEIWEKKFSRGMTATLGPARLLPHRNGLTRRRSSAARQGCHIPSKKNFFC